MTNSLSEFPYLVLAIDGGAASGKSSTSFGLAQRLNLVHVDTGTHYRSVTLACLQNNIRPESGDALRRFLNNLVFSSDIQGNSCAMKIGDNSFSIEEMRSDKVNTNVSLFAALPEVRECVKAYQRGLVRFGKEMGFAGIVMDGRDIGTVILPGADLKIFLTADPQTRQARRIAEGQGDSIGERDKIDSSRKTAPLKAADDAIVLDNSSLELDEVIEIILGEIQKRLTGGWQK